VVALHVTPRAARDAIEDVDGEGAIRVRVTAAPADGAANKAVLELLAKSLGLPKGAVTLRSGASSRHKRVRLAGVQAATVQRRWPGASVRDA
jgi:uncharacterized protein (TIGR00251 family)